MFVVFIKALLVGFLASIPLGPVGILCIQKTLSKGKYSGLLTGLGAALADTVYASMALLSLAFIQNWLAEKKLWVMLVGGIIIMFTGLRIAMRDPLKQFRLRHKGESGSSGRYISELIQGLAINITNPGTVVLLLGCFALVKLNLDKPMQHMPAAALTGVFLGAALWWFALSTLINIFRSKFRLRTIMYINRISGIILAALGFISAVDGIYMMIVPGL